MVKLIIGRGSNKVSVLGLSQMNLQKLQEGMPIVFDAADVELGRGKILIVYGETEEAIIGDLRDQGVQLPEGTLPQ
jgi:hypothetical protein